jgi:hypothetical protein
MNIEDIKTIEQAKAICYDQIRLLNQTQQNIQMLEARISQLEEEKKT